MESVEEVGAFAGVDGFVHNQPLNPPLIQSGHSKQPPTPVQKNEFGKERMVLELWR